MIVGVGIGGDFEQCALLAKQALCRDLDQANPDPFYAELEQEMLQQVNQLGIGSQGFGGDVTALGLNIRNLCNSYCRVTSSGEHGLPCDPAYVCRTVG